MKIDVDDLRRKRTGLDSVMHFIPGILKNDLNFRPIKQRTAELISAQSSGLEEPYYRDTSELYDEDVQLISKDGKVYYLPTLSE